MVRLGRRMASALAVPGTAVATVLPSKRVSAVAVLSKRPASTSAWVGA